MSVSLTSRFQALRSVSSGFQQGILKNPRLFSTNKTIHKYEIPIKDEMTIQMPEGAEVIDLLIQNNKPQLFAIVNPNAPMKSYSFSLRGTGHPLIGDEGIFVRSFMLLDGAFVGHLFIKASL